MSITRGAKQGGSLPNTMHNNKTQFNVNTLLQKGVYGQVQMADSLTNRCTEEN